MQYITRRLEARRSGLRCATRTGALPELVPSSRFASAEAGFSLVEITVSMALFGAVVVLVSAMLTTGLSGVLLGQRREVATREASRVMEVARSLSYEQVALDEDDPTLDDDSRVEERDGVLSYLVDASTDRWEPLVLAGGSSDHPFSPHRETVQRGATELTRYVYVTGVDELGDGSYDYRRVLVRVEFPDEGAANPQSHVTMQTFIDESGAIPAGLVPLTADAVAGGAVASVRSDRGDLDELIDAVLPPDPIHASLPGTEGDGDLRSVNEVGCTGTSAYIEDSDGTTYGEHTVSARADDSPTSSYPTEDSDSYSGTDTVPDSGDTALLEESSIGSSLSCLADALHEGEGLPYGEGDGALSTSVTMTEDLSGAGLESDTLTVFSADQASALQAIDADAVSDGREVTSRAEASFGDVFLLQTAGVLPNGLVRVRAFEYGAAATASEGTPSQAPSVDVPNRLVLEIFDPEESIGVCTTRSGEYCIIDVDPTSSGFSGFSISQEGTVTANSGDTELHYEIAVEAFPPSTSPDDGVAGTNHRRWSAEYLPLDVSARLQVSLLSDGLLLTDSEAAMSYADVSARGCAGVGCQ